MKADRMIVWHYLHQDQRLLLPVLVNLNVSAFGILGDGMGVFVLIMFCVYFKNSNLKMLECHMIRCSLKRGELLSYQPSLYT